jgi:mannose-6-phosphate isomerase-like protein (cupin superfamily)
MNGFFVVALAALALAGCAAEATSALAGAARAPSPKEAGGAVVLAPYGPVEAAFAEAPARVPASRCARLFVAVASGEAAAAGEKLHEGDVLVLARQAEVAVSGRALLLVARRAVACEGEAEKTLVRGGAAEELTWAGGRMHAHLDVGTGLSPEIYFGRLAGTASVAEHTHPGAWEVLAAVEAAGTFTIAGEPHRLGAREILAVPPDTKHAWAADPGSRLVALQMYDPPGPEQRFVGLAKAAAGEKAGEDATRAPAK